MHSFLRFTACSLLLVLATFATGCAGSWNYSTGLDGAQRPRLRPLLPWRRAQQKTFEEPMLSALPDRMPPRRGSLPTQGMPAASNEAAANDASAEQSAEEPSVYTPSERAAEVTRAPAD